MSGEVILVSQRSSFQLFAVKMFSLASDDKEKRMREFYREAQVMQTVSHRHLVPCLFAALCKGYTVITMPFYCGTDLCNLSEHGKLHPSVAGRYISQVAQAVEHLHKNSIVHNDIKLENIFIDEADQAILGNPGLALMSENHCETTTAGMVGGTKAYWPPERVMAARNDQLDPFKADVYTKGVVFWLLTFLRKEKTTCIVPWLLQMCFFLLIIVPACRGQHVRGENSIKIARCRSCFESVRE
ncbi:serine/threonine protein kinase [Elysia marginata]|uniref:Serine/threonine protein kinase n=1 Tax=Elysia marginata TaxID=1093978 RepID=A0AAV4GM99_9GAST|nr:serine/threonine protein kinase [Elysia marginata]